MKVLKGQREDGDLRQGVLSSQRVGWAKPSNLFLLTFPFASFDNNYCESIRPVDFAFIWNYNHCALDSH